MASQVASISLETYIQLHEALTKGKSHVQPVTPIEEHFFKVQDLKQVQSSQ